MARLAIGIGGYTDWHAAQPDDVHRTFVGCWGGAQRRRGEEKGGGISCMFPNYNDNEESKADYKEVYLSGCPPASPNTAHQQNVRGKTLERKKREK